MIWFVDFYWDGNRMFKQCFSFNVRSYICKLNSDYYRFSIVWSSLINVSWGGQDFINWTFAYFISGECNDQLSRCHLPMYYVSGITKEFFRKWASVENLTYINTYIILYLYIFFPFNFVLEKYFQIIFSYLIIYSYVSFDNNFADKNREFFKSDLF